MVARPTFFFVAVCSSGWSWFPGTWSCAVDVASGLPLWRASWPCVGAPCLVRSGCWRCANQLSCSRCAFPYQGLAPLDLLGGCAGHVEASPEPGSWCLPLAPPWWGCWAGSALYPFGAPRWGWPLLVSPALVSGCVRCSGFAHVEPVTQRSGFPYCLSPHKGLSRCIGALSCGRQHIPLRL